MFKQQNLGHTWLTKIYENVFHLYHFSFLMWLLENWELPTCVSLYSMDSRVGDSQISQICSRNAGCHSSMKPFPTQGLLKVIVSQEAWSPAAWEDTLSHTAESVCVCPCTGQAAFKDVLLGDTPSLITKKKKVTEMGKPQNEQIQMLNRTVNTSSSSLRYKNQPWVHLFVVIVLFKTVSAVLSVTTSLCSHLRMKTTSLKTTALSTEHEFCQRPLEP